MKLKSHLTAGIFGILSFAFAIIGFAIIVGGAASAVDSQRFMNVNEDTDISGISAFFTGAIFSIVVPAIFGIGVFVSGIVEIVQSTQTTKSKGIGLTAGILNIVTGFFTFIPIIGWITPIIGIIFSFIAYSMNTK